MTPTVCRGGDVAKHDVNVQARRAEALSEAAGQDSADTRQPAPGDEVRPGRLYVLGPTGLCD